MNRLRLFSLSLSFFLFWGQSCNVFGQKTQQEQETDILHYNLHVTIPSVSKAYIEGVADIRYRVLKQGVKYLTLELQALEIKKLELVPSGKALYIHVGDSIQITFEPQDTGIHHIVIEYAGTPKPPSSFGGLYFRDGYFYNMGVGIRDIPHNLGKAWFPCRDNFTDKATYTIQVTAPKGLWSVASGVEQPQIMRESGMETTTWELRQPIPTYLAAVAVGPFAVWRDTLAGVERRIPVSIFAADSLIPAVPASFGRLKQAFSTFERLLGPYAFDRVGYVCIPFDGGAMEHATNIGYPMEYVNGKDEMDHLWMHELSHSWFGNLVTCSSASDMWLNEGFARYCEGLCFEAIQGRAALLDFLALCNEKVTRFSTRIDGGFIPLSPLPDEHTYGITTYDKGGLVAHHLRCLLGDSAFFGGIRAWFAEHRFGNGSSDEFRRTLEKHSGRDLGGFFEQEVYTGGLTGWTINNITIQPNGKYHVYLDPQNHQKPIAAIPSGTVSIMIFTADNQLIPYLNLPVQSGDFRNELPFVEISINETPASAWLHPTENAYLNFKARLDTLSGTQTVKLDNCFIQYNKAPKTVYAQISRYLLASTESKTFLGDKFFRIEGTKGVKIAQLDFALPDDSPELPVSYTLFYRKAAKDSWKSVKATTRKAAGKAYLSLKKAPLGDYVVVQGR
jgi:hypothetical protein